MNSVLVVKEVDSCPFMTEAAGNLPTEDLCFMLKSLDYSKNIFIEKLVDASKVTQKLFYKSSGIYKINERIGCY